MSELPSAGVNSPPAQISPPAWRFSLAELMLFVTLVAACLAIGRWVPLLGLLCGIYLLPVAFHARRSHRICQRNGMPLNCKEHIGNVIYSCLIVLLALAFYLEMLFFTMACGMTVIAGLGFDSSPIAILLVSILAVLCLLFPFKLLNMFKLRPQLRQQPVRDS